MNDTKDKAMHKIRMSAFFHNIFISIPCVCTYSRGACVCAYQIWVQSYKKKCIYANLFSFFMHIANFYTKIVQFFSQNKGAQKNGAQRTPCDLRYS